MLSPLSSDKLSIRSAECCSSSVPTPDGPCTLRGYATYKSQVFGRTFSQRINPKRLQILRTQSRLCCCNSDLNFSPQLISVLRDWQNGYLRLRTRRREASLAPPMTALLATIPVRPEPSRSTTLSITMEDRRE